MQAEVILKITFSQFGTYIFFTYSNKRSHGLKSGGKSMIHNEGWTAAYQMHLKKWNKTAPSAMKHQVCINLKSRLAYSKQTKKHAKPKQRGA